MPTPVVIPRPSTHQADTHYFLAREKGREGGREGGDVLPHSQRGEGEKRSGFSSFFLFVIVLFRLFFSG